MSHMAPEALLHGHISKAADVYAYGITLWELFTGGQAYQGDPTSRRGQLWFLASSCRKAAAQR
jgi:serine/threonine protein kinase